jgi:hypothetical protein
MGGHALNLCGDVEKQFALRGPSIEDRADEPHLNDWNVRRSYLETFQFRFGFGYLPSYDLTEAIASELFH